MDKGLDPGERLLAERLQQGFEGLSLPQNAVDDVHGQMAFAADERALDGYLVKEYTCRQVGAFELTEGLDCCEARCLLLDFRQRIVTRSGGYQAVNGGDKLGYG